MTTNQTIIALVRDHLEDWRRENRWSRETLADQIVLAHVAHGFDRLTGVMFEPPTRDTFERMRVNADRIYRWLDDSTKDKNLLTANFLWSILASLPMPRRLSLVADLLAPIGLVAEVDEHEDGDLDEAAMHLHIQEMVESSAAATVALVQVQAGDSLAPEAAIKKLSRLRAAGAACKRILSKFRLRREVKA